MPAFQSAVATITAADLPSSYRPGCPTPPSQLRMLTLTYVDFSGQPQTGHLVVNAAHAAQVVAIFTDLYAHRFPIRRMVPVDAYGGSDDRSVAADNTAGFNCRAAVASGPTSWSMHAYGEAIDVDPVENPYVENNGTVDPAAGKVFEDRSDHRAGMAYDGGELVDAFARQGWRWGDTFQDYQHFSTNGK
ncbi:MAG TPA: M15 family metallopeptidase [Mycobacteriales bacterium]